VRGARKFGLVLSGAAVASATVLVALASGGDDDGIALSLKGRYTGGGAEIAAYDKKSKRVFVTDAGNRRVDIISIADPASPAFVSSISVAPGSPNSVAVTKGIVAIAVEAALKTDPGTVRFFDANGASLHPGVTVGALPDMLTFTPNGDYLLVANEGEPSGYGPPPAGITYADPEGSVSVIDVRRGIDKLTQSDVRTASFAGLPIPTGVRIFGPGATPEQDLEPEYIAVSERSMTAWVTLQENNAIATLDVRNATFTSIAPLGFKNHSLPGNALDPSDRDGVGNNGRKEIVNRPVFGMYMPDGIASIRAHGETFLLTANEGDARTDWPGFNEESTVGDLAVAPGIEASVVNPPELILNDLTAFGRLKVTKTLGNTDADPAYEALYAFGARSFSIWSESGQQVYDSGDDFEQITSSQLPALFNSEGGLPAEFDKRSDNKGPEPEGITVGEVRDRTYAFIGLERIGGVMVYDVSDPAEPTFVQYVNPAPAVDRAPEGVLYISRSDSPNGRPLLVVTNEASFTTAIYEIAS
jgi:hypothetical protein